MKRKVLYTLFVLIISSESILAQVNLEAGLVAYYSFNENFNDQTEFQNDGSSFSEPSFVNDAWGLDNAAVSFDGENDYLLIPSSDQNNLEETNEFAISFKLRAPQNQDDLGAVRNYILTKWNNIIQTQSYPFSIHIYNQTSSGSGRIWASRFAAQNTSCSDNIVLESSTAVNDGEWHNVVYQKKDGQLELYIDGNLEGIEIDDNCSNVNPTDILVGARALNLGPNALRAYKGDLDELRLYNRSLNEDEITLLGNKPSLSTSRVPQSENVSIYPNPIQNNGTIRLDGIDPSELSQVLIFDLGGREVEELNDDYTFSGKISSGTYLIKIALENGTTIVKRIQIL